MGQTLSQSGKFGPTVKETICFECNKRPEYQPFSFIFFVKALQSNKLVWLDDLMDLMHIPTNFLE